MSADGINYMATQAPKKIPLQRKNLHILNLIADKKVWEGVWGNLFLKKVPPRTNAMNFL